LITQIRVSDTGELEYRRLTSSQFEAYCDDYYAKLRERYPDGPPG